MLDTVPTDLLADLRNRHGEQQRYYHDWTHIEALLTYHDRLGDRVGDREAALYAILFHDAVYDPKAHDNERRSAELLNATDVPLADASKQLAFRMIRATEGHVLPSDLAGRPLEDLALFLDMDLAILGAAEAQFDNYEHQIRREYSHVSDQAFRQGRMTVLGHFASRERLYYSDWGLERFEERARANISRSLAALAAHETVRR